MIRKSWLPLLLAIVATPVFAGDDDDDDRRGRSRGGWGWEQNRDRGNSGDWRRNDRNRNGTYSDRNGTYGDRNGTYGDRNGTYGDRNGTYGRYGGNGAYVVDQAMSNLRRISSRNRYDSHERNHFERALYHLDRFRNNYAREQRFDKGQLDDAIKHIDDLADARQVNSRDRDVLARDLQALRSFRSQRGSYSR